MEDGQKWCNRCRELKPVAEFNKKRDGLQGYCRACNSAYLKGHYQANGDYYRAKAAATRRKTKRATRRRVSAYLLDHPCVDCGEADPLVLQFDHVRGSKTFAIATLVGRGASWERVEAEMAKCEVRCANCHQRRTSQQFDWYSGLDVEPTNGGARLTLTDSRNAAR